MSRKKIIIVIFITIVLGLALFVVLRSLTSSTEQPAAPTKSKTQVEGASSSTELTPSDNEIAQKSINEMVNFNEPKNSASYIAVVRSGSIVRATTPSGSPTLRYLVDIPQLQRTFIVEREGDATSDFASLYVRCPSVADLRYAAKECKDME